LLRIVASTSWLAWSAIFWPFEAHRPRVDAELGQVIVVGQLAHAAAGGQQGLGGHAAAVDAGTAHVAAFDDGHLEAVFAAVLGRVEAAVAGPDHEHIEIEAAVAHGPRIHQLSGILSCRQRSSSSGAAATATLSDSTAALWGMQTRWVASSSRAVDSPGPSAPNSSRVGRRQSSCR
jgi:hypothetical protein